MAVAVDINRRVSTTFEHRVLVEDNAVRFKLYLPARYLGSQPGNLSERCLCKADRFEAALKYFREIEASDVVLEEAVRVSRLDKLGIEDGKQVGASRLAIVPPSQVHHEFGEIVSCSWVIHQVVVSCSSVTC